MWAEAGGEWQATTYRTRIWDVSEASPASLAATWVRKGRVKAEYAYLRRSASVSSALSGNLGGEGQIRVFETYSERI